MSSDSIANGNNATINALDLNHALIEQLKSTGHLQSEGVEAAFRAVPRHLFLPELPLERVYTDRAIPTKFANGKAISSSSQPAIMATMLEQLDIQPGHHILEIGAGTGYNAALMAHLVGDKGVVTAVDLDEDTADKARNNLAAAGFEQVQVVCSDGMAGYANRAPYDRIILTVGGWDISPYWVDQLKEDGRILLPLSIKGPQLSVAFDRQNDHFVSASVKPCGFMRIRGESAEPQNQLQLGPDPGLTLESYTAVDAIDPQKIYQWLHGSHQDQSTAVMTTPRQIFRSLLLWLSLNESRKCHLAARGDTVEKGVVPYLSGSFGDHKWQVTAGVVMADGLGVLMRPPDTTMPPPLLEPGETPPPFTLFVRSFGPSDAAGQRMIDLIQAWDTANKPGVEGLRIRAFPVTAKLASVAGTHIVRKRWYQFLLDYGKRSF